MNCCWKIVLLLSCCYTFDSAIVFAQEVRKIRIEKEFNEMDYAPQISGYFDGKVSSDKICDPTGIITRKGWRIVSFEINYCTGSDEGVRIAGNQIPDSICMYLQTRCIDSDVYFNKIKAVSEEGVLRNLNPMRLVPVEVE